MAKMKIPKSVAGVKVPKKVRKQAKKALKAAENPVVREFATAALGAAAAQARRHQAETSARSVRNAARNMVGVNGERLAEAVRAAAADGLRRFLEGFEEGLRQAEAAQLAEDEVPRAPRPGRRSPRASGSSNGADAA